MHSNSPFPAILTGIRQPKTAQIIISVLSNLKDLGSIQIARKPLDHNL